MESWPRSSRLLQRFSILDSHCPPLCYISRLSAPRVPGLAGQSVLLPPEEQGTFLLCLLSIFFYGCCLTFLQGN